MARIKCSVCGRWAMKRNANVKYCCATCLSIINNRDLNNRRKIRRIERRLSNPMGLKTKKNETFK